MDTLFPQQALQLADIGSPHGARHTPLEMSPESTIPLDLTQASCPKGVLCPRCAASPSKLLYISGASAVPLPWCHHVGFHSALEHTKRTDDKRDVEEAQACELV
mmetsp:Transcript_25263/g.66221  ORF Transcript_25263/g.66221 Transcript_25263/m.66221 type:complete len:104 (-) Transcript_25263:283-594(-)